MLDSTAKRACADFHSSKPLVLFGAGLIGGTVLDILGKDKVQFFADNSQNKIGKEYKGVRVISFDEYITLKDQFCHPNATIIATV